MAATLNYSPSSVSQQLAILEREVGVDGDPHRTIFTSIRAAGAHHPAIEVVRGALEETARALAG